MRPRQKRKYVKSGKYSKRNLGGNSDRARIEDPMPKKELGFSCHFAHLKVLLVDRLTNCPRCGQTHNGIVCRTFDKAIRVGHFVFPYWSVCPETGEPIILQDPRDAQDTDASADKYKALVKDLMAIRRPTLAPQHYPAGADAIPAADARD